MAVSLASATVDDLCAVFALPVGIGARIERVLQHRNYITIADRRPLERDHLLRVRRTGEVHAFGPERQVSLPGAPELAEPTEDQPCRPLASDVWVQAQSDLSMPDEPYGHRDPQLPPPRLRTRGVEHPRAQDSELELTDAPLHAEKEPIVGAAGVVDAVQVNDARLDKPAELEEVVPVTTVSGESRCIETQ